MIAARRRPLTARQYARLFVCEQLASAVTDDDALVCVLGHYRATSPRLAVRWLRHRTRRLADQLDPPEPWPGDAPLDVVPVADPTAPDHLRQWSADPAAHERLMARLAVGHAFRLTVIEDDSRFAFTVDAFPPHCGYCPCRQDSAAAPMP